MIVAGASAGDVYVVVMFTALVSLARGGSVSWKDFVGIPVSMVTGVLLGLLVGIALVRLFAKSAARATKKCILLLGSAFLLVALESKIRQFFPYAGYLAVISMGMYVLARQPSAVCPWRWAFPAERWRCLPPFWPSFLPRRSARWPSTRATADASHTAPCSNRQSDEVHVHCTQVPVRATVPVGTDRTADRPDGRRRPHPIAERITQNVRWNPPTDVFSVSSAFSGSRSRSRGRRRQAYTRAQNLSCRRPHSSCSQDGTSRASDHRAPAFSSAYRCRR